MQFALQPSRALEYYAFAAPGRADAQLVANIFRLYAARNLYMGASIFLSSLLGSSKLLGALQLAAGAVAIADGAVSKAQTGGGEWNHW